MAEAKKQKEHASKIRRLSQRTAGQHFVKHIFIIYTSERGNEDRTKRSITAND